MKTKKNKKLILSLIKDDLMNTKLINGLNNIGLDAGNYYLHLSQTFFILMGFGNFNQDEELYEEYFNLSEKAIITNRIENPEQLNSLALEVYNKLLAEKEKRKSKKGKQNKLTGVTF